MSDYIFISEKDSTRDNIVITGFTGVSVEMIVDETIKKLDSKADSVILKSDSAYLHNQFSIIKKELNVEIDGEEYYQQLVALKAENKNYLLVLTTLPSYEVLRQRDFNFVIDRIIDLSR